MAMRLSALVFSAGQLAAKALETKGCDFGPLVFADMHDGDKKSITVRNQKMAITPSGNDQKWEVDTTLDCGSGTAKVDFHVPGKPGPPPVDYLAATLWSSSHGYTFEFTDPSGKLAAKDYPLNHWVQLRKGSSGSTSCPQSMTGVFADMHDGDKKQVDLQDGVVTIKPSGNNQSWTIRSEPVDYFNCTAVVDFNVPGKPSPPPVKLTLSMFEAVNIKNKKTFIEFIDPSGTLAAKTYPLNRWVEVESGGCPATSTPCGKYCCTADQECHSEWFDKSCFNKTSSQDTKLV